MFALQNPIQNYAWGSHTDIASLRGEPGPSELPQAELWMGAHPNAPSHVVLPDRVAPLDAVIAADPMTWLGAEPLPGYAQELPFLVKLLAASQPLSIQTHPNAARARQGFAAEEEAGIPRDAPHRNYRDPHPKPELIYALSPFEVLCGFRPMHELRAIFDALPRSAVSPVRDALQGATSPRDAFSCLMHLAEPHRAAMIEAALGSCYTHADDEGPVGSACRIALRLARFFPGDIGLLGAMMLHHLRLEAGQALFLTAGQLHSYVEGFGLEVMTNSDNVLRGGLTPKHVDVPELLSVLDFEAPPAELVCPRTLAPGRVLFPTPAAEFTLHELDLRGSPVPLATHGPEILVCIRGRVHAHSSRGTVELSPGESAIAPASTETYHVHGQGQAFRVTLGTILHA